MQRIGWLVAITFLLVSCQFTETMVLNENGSGRMNVHVNMDEMMSFGAMGFDTATVKVDTIIEIKQFLEAKKDSIATLSEAKQQRLKKLEDYTLHMVMDTESSQLQFEMYRDFKNISEVVNLMEGLNEGSALLPAMDKPTGEDSRSTPETMGVKYSFENDIFKRDAYIIDPELHQIKVDSMQSAKAFMTGMSYHIKYTFPKRIKTSSVADATYSLDGKTIEVERSFVDYMENPDVLDVEVELEK